MNSQPIRRRGLADIHRRDPDNRLTLLIAGAAALGIALVLAREAVHGVSIHGNSLYYVVAAHGLLAGHGLTTVEGTPFALWPPVYPLLLAAASLGVFKPVAVAGFLNAAIFVLIIFVVGRYLGGRLRLRALAVWAGLATALAPPLVEMAATAMSEPAFILLATLALARTDDYLARGRTASLAWAALFAALAWQTRYIGVAVPVAVGLALLLQPGATPWQRVRRASFVWLAAALLMALWHARSYLACGGRWCTDFDGNPYPLHEILASVGAGFRTWAPFGPSPLGWPSLALLAVAATALVWAGSRLVREPQEPRAREGGTGYDWRTFAVWAGFALVYLVLLVVAIERGNTDRGMLDRYLAPMYVPFLVVVVLAVDRLLGRARGRRLSGGAGGLPGPGRFGRGWSSLPAVVMAVALALWLAANAQRSLSDILWARPHKRSLSYGGLPWAGSETLRYLRGNPVDGRVYSNEAGVVLLNNDGTGTYRWMYLFKRPPPETVLPDGATVVWLRKSWSSGPGAGHLLASPMFTPLAERADGLILRVRNRPPFDVELAGKTLTWRKAPCTPADVRPRFILKVFPVDADDLPAHRLKPRSRPQRHLLPYEWMNFDFRRYGTIRDGECRAVVTLPGYDVAGVKIGQRTEAGLLWSAWLADGDAVEGVATPFAPRANPYRSARAAIATGGFGPPIRPAPGAGGDGTGGSEAGAFDLYLHDGTLAWLKEPCTAGDTAPRFFLHVFPADPADLPIHRRRYSFRHGFDNRDFRFEDFGIRFDGRWGGTCLALVRLPDYAIASLRTGQFVSGSGPLWKIEIERP